MISDDILSFLVDKGYGTIGTSLLLNAMPEQSPTPDNVISLYPVQSPAVSTTREDQIYNFVIINRNKDYDAAQSQIYSIYKMIDGKSFTINDRHVLFSYSSPPSFLLEDDVGRTKFTYDFSLITKQD